MHKFFCYNKFIKIKEKTQCIRQKTGAQNIVQEIKQYQEKCLKHVQRHIINFIIIIIIMFLKG